MAAQAGYYLQELRERVLGREHQQASHPTHAHEPFLSSVQLLTGGQRDQPQLLGAQPEGGPEAAPTPQP